MLDTENSVNPCTGSCNSQWYSTFDHNVLNDDANSTSSFKMQR